MEKELNVRYRLPHLTDAQWGKLNPTLKDGEVAFSTDTRMYKIGDGNTLWKSLPYNNAVYASSSSSSNVADHVKSSLTIQGNGTSLGAFDGSAPKTVNITPTNIGAASSTHAHDDAYYSKADIDSKLSTIVNNAKRAVLDAVYPVGSLYMSTNNVNPGTFIGGTWQSWGSGRTIVSVDTNDTDFNAADKTGGEKTHILTASEMPSHTHNIPGHSHGIPAHSHTVGAHTHTLNSHTHSVGAHAHGLNSHTHSIPALSGTAATKSLVGKFWNFCVQSKETGLSTSGICAKVKTDTSVPYPSNTLYVQNAVDSVEIDASHAHTVATKASTTGAATGSTANSTAFNTGAAAGNTGESTAFSSSDWSGQTNATTDTASGATGSGTAHNNMPPYITCFMWKRIS